MTAMRRDHRFDALSDDTELAPHFHVEETILLPALNAVGAQDLSRRTLQEHAKKTQPNSALETVKKAA